MIAVFITNDYERKTHYHEFSKVKNEYASYNKSLYDIPFYYPHPPKGYAIFSTFSEMKKVENYLAKLKEIKRTRRISFEDEPIEKEPEPKKEHSYCQLCYIDYEDYKSHIVSSLHREKIAKHSENYNKISLTFERIRLFWVKDDKKMSTLDNRSPSSLITSDKTDEKEEIVEETKIVPDIQKTKMENKPMDYQLIIKKDRRDDYHIMSDISTQTTIGGKKEYVLCKIEKRKLHQLQYSTIFNIRERRTIFKTNQYFIPQYKHMK